MVVKRSRRFESPDPLSLKKSRQMTVAEITAARALDENFAELDGITEGLNGDLQGLESPEVDLGHGRNDVERNIDHGTVESRPTEASPVSTDDNAELQDKDSTGRRDVAEAQYQPLFDVDDIKDCSETLKKRLLKMITYANHSSVRYAPQLIPKNIAWGPRLLYDDMSNYLCLEGHQEPLNVWVVGRICGLWFQGKNGPVDRASVTVIPLTSNDAKLVTKFVRALANPPEATPPSDATSLRFSRWMSRNMNPPIPFTDYYDGTEVYRTKKDMPKLDIKTMKKRDLVLVEGHVMRYRVTDPTADNASDSGGKKGKDKFRKVGPAPWLKWKSLLELRCISLLKSYTPEDDAAEEIEF